MCRGSEVVRSGTKAGAHPFGSMLLGLSLMLGLYIPPYLAAWYAQAAAL